MSETTPIVNLRSFIKLLRAERELVEINCQVDPYLEIAEIHRRTISAAGPALLFNNIKGAKFPLITNLFGTKKRIDLAFGKRPENLIASLAKLPEHLMPPSIAKLWGERKTLSSLLKVGLRSSTHGPVQQVELEKPRLQDLPLLTTWEEDGGAFFTLPLVYTEHPDTGQHNLGMYRLQRFNDSQTGFHCQIGKGAGFHLARAKEKNQKLAVNVFLGGPPALILSAIAPLPENVPELLLCSLLQGSKLSTCKNSFGPLALISEAEFAFVGEVDPTQSRAEGPFGDHYGYYSLTHDYPVFQVNKMLHRHNPICTATVVGKPRQEDFFLGDYLQELLRPLFPLVMPAVKDLWSYGETGYHSLAAAVVKQRYKREAMASAFRILGEGQLSLTKFLLILDQDLDLQKFSAVLEHVLERADFRSDLYLFSQLAMDSLDYNGPTINEGSKGVLLGTGPAIRKLNGEFIGDLPRGVRDLKVFCRGCLVVQGPSSSSDSNFAALLASDSTISEWPLVILVDDVNKTCASEMSFLWTTFTRFNPSSHIFAKRSWIADNHICYEGPIVIDARLKPNFPAELECDARTSKLVSDRWREYFI